MKKLTTYLTFKEKGLAAVKFYVSLFEGSKINHTELYPAGAGMPDGALMNASFELAGQEFMAMDGGEHFTFGEGFSILVNAETQQEIDHLWDKLTDGGEEQRCGWLKDKYGISWQIVPPILGELLTNKDPQKAQSAMQAMLKMKKIDIQALLDSQN